MRYVSCALLVVVLAVPGCSHDEGVSLDPRLSRETAGATSAARYTIAYLPTLGGSRNRPSSISNNGLIAGFVNRPSNATRVAAFWRGGSLDTHGTLGGPNSDVHWPGISSNGMIPRFPETPGLDPLHEGRACPASLAIDTG